MPQEDKKYNRTVCTFCPLRDVCNTLRSAIHCGDCKYTIPCTQQEGPGLVDCGPAKDAWHDASLPCKCMLAMQVLADPPEGLVIEPLTGQSTVSAAGERGSEGTEAYALCPRCNCQTAMITTSYEWVPGKKTTTHRRIQCGVCSLDVHETFE